MSYQPNPFVNPNQRGVELPAGCKDLMDVLKKPGSGKNQQLPSSIERGSLKKLTGHMRRLYETEPVGRALFVTVLEQRAELMALHREGGFELTFLLRKWHKIAEEMVKDLFDEGEIQVKTDESKTLRTISIPLPDSWLEAARLIELIIRAYEVPEDTPLLFHFGGKKD